MNEILDSTTDLEEATSCELDTKDKKASDEQEEGNGLQCPCHDVADELLERCTSTQLEDSISAS